MFKKFLVPTFFLLFTVTSAIGQNAVDELFSRYGDDTEFRMINVSSTMFKLMAKSEKAAADPALAELISKLKGMRVLVKEESGKCLL